MIKNVKNKKLPQLLWLHQTWTQTSLKQSEPECGQTSLTQLQLRVTYCTFHSTRQEHCISLFREITIFSNSSSDCLEDIAIYPQKAGFVISGAWVVSKVLEGSSAQRPAPWVLVSYFTVVVLVSGAAEHPTSGPEFQDLQQQQAGHGREALLEQKAVPQQEEQVIHPLVVRLLQLLSDAMQLHHQTVHLWRKVETPQ